MTRSLFISTLRRYMGKVQTLRDEARTARFLESLPEELRKDIGWPDYFPGRRPS